MNDIVWPADFLGLYVATMFRVVIVLVRHLEDQQNGGLPHLAIGSPQNMCMRTV